MEFEYSKKAVGSFEWEEWVCIPYKIVCYRPGHFYAYYLKGNEAAIHVCKPPHLGKCPGCRAASCTGTHEIWDSLEAAKKDCLEHYANLPF